MSDVFSGEIIYAAHNADLESRVDVLEARYVTSMVVKSGDETINNSATLQADDQLTLPVAANAVYVGTVSLMYNANASAGFKLDFTAPSGTTFENSQFLVTVSGAITYGATNTLGAVSGMTGTGANVPYRGWFTVYTSSTAGSIALRWAQNTAHASNLIVRKGSYLTLVRYS